MAGGGEEARRESRVTATTTSAGGKPQPDWSSKPPQNSQCKCWPHQVTPGHRRKPPHVPGKDMLQHPYNGLWVQTFHAGHSSSIRKSAFGENPHMAPHGAAVVSQAMPSARWPPVARSTPFVHCTFVAQTVLLSGLGGTTLRRKPIAQDAPFAHAELLFYVRNEVKMMRPVHAMAILSTSCPMRTQGPSSPHFAGWRKWAIDMFLADVSLCICV